MKKIELRSRQWIRKLFGGVSLTAMAFVFQACYGPLPDDAYDVKFTGTVTSKTTNLPVKGIKVSVNEGLNYGFTDENGKFYFFASFMNREGYSRTDSVNIQVLDVDGPNNGLFADKMIVVEAINKKEVKLDVELEEVK